MEPQIIDFYTKEPLKMKKTARMRWLVNNMSDELYESQKEIETLKNKIKLLEYNNKTSSQMFIDSVNAIGRSNRRR